WIVDCYGSWVNGSTCLVDQPNQFDSFPFLLRVKYLPLAHFRYAFYLNILDRYPSSHDPIRNDDQFTCSIESTDIESRISFGVSSLLSFLDSVLYGNPGLENPCEDVVCCSVKYTLGGFDAISIQTVFSEIQNRCSTTDCSAKSNLNLLVLC